MNVIQYFHHTDNIIWRLLKWLLEDRPIAIKIHIPKLHDLLANCCQSKSKPWHLMLHVQAAANAYTVTLTYSSSPTSSWWLHFLLPPRGWKEAFHAKDNKYTVAIGAGPKLLKNKRIWLWCPLQFFSLCVCWNPYQTIWYFYMTVYKNRQSVYFCLLPVWFVTLECTYMI